MAALKFLFKKGWHPAKMQVFNSAGWVCHSVRIRGPLTFAAVQINCCFPVLTVALVLTVCACRLTVFIFFPF